MRRIQGWLVVLCCTTLSGESPTYVGANTCATCHAAQFAQQSASGHARSLYPAAEHPLAASFAPSRRLLRKPNYRFQFSLSPGQFRVQVFDDENVMDIPIEWAFGAGEQAVTFVSRVNEDWYVEHYYSYYTALRSLAPTPGQQALEPKTLPEAVGLVYKSLDPQAGIKGCFECHSTGPVSVEPDRKIRPSESGVCCEACHGAGSLHVRTATEGKIARARELIQNPKRLASAELNRFCGTCHRPPAGAGVAIDWGYAWNVRHQPVYFSQSACFRKSNGALSCLTCHNPHEPLRKNDSAYYNQRCGTCHHAKLRPPSEVCQSRLPSNCVDCHMPRVSPQSPLRFSNHWIGVYRQDARLKPSR